MIPQQLIDFLIFTVFLPLQNFLSISQYLTCHVLTVSVIGIGIVHLTNNKQFLHPLYYANVQVFYVSYFVSIKPLEHLMYQK